MRKKIFFSFLSSLIIIVSSNVNSSSAQTALPICNDDNGCSIVLNKSDTFVKNAKELEEVIFSKMLILEKKFKISWNENTISGNDIKKAIKNITSKPEIIEIYSGNTVTYSTDYLEMNVRYKTNLDTDKKVKSYVKNWVKKNIKSNMSDEQKVKTIHDFMVTNFNYNFGDENEKSGGHSIYIPSSLIYGEGGVCQAYSTLFYKMAKESGLEAQFIAGVSKNNYYSGPHAWNMVKIDGDWYHIDVTWNDPIPDNPNKIYYDYYLKSDKFMSNSHKWETDKYPKATKNYKD